MIKRLPFIAALLLLGACNSFKAGLYEDNLSMPLREGSADSLQFSVSLEYPLKGLSAEALERLENTLLTTAFDLEEQPGTLEETAIRYRENLVDEYFTENGNPELEAPVKTWNDEITGRFEPAWKDKLCYSLTYYAFRGGAHGLYTITYLVFDRKTGALLTEDDLFREGYREPVSALMRESIRQSILDLEQPDMLEAIAFENVAPNGNFLPDEKGLSWLFQPYDIAPYAMGALSADVSWEQLKPYLK